MSICSPTRDSVLRQAVVNEATSWLRTPYHHRAKIKGVGVDCAQILIEVYFATGVIPERPPVEAYVHDWHIHRSEEKYLHWVQRYCKRVEKPKAGDIALFKFGRCVSHSAIVVEYPSKLIHAYIGRGVVFASAHDAELKDRLHSFWNPFND